MLINGHELHVEQYGAQDRPIVVLLHHGLGSLKAWREQIPTLVASGYRVIAYDRWGYGESAVRPGLDLPGFTTDIDDLHGLFESLRIQQAALIGHSDGGTIALYFSAQYPDYVRCLVIVAAHIYVESRMKMGALGIKRAFEADERFQMGMRYAHGEKYEQTFHNWFNGWYHTKALDWDMRPMLSQISCRALVVQGEEDEHATSQHAIDIAKAIPRAELWLLPKAGHMLPMENANQFNPRLLEFLEKYDAIQH